MRNGFLDSKIGKIPHFSTKPEQNDTKYKSLRFKSVNSIPKRTVGEVDF
jgi:hypothetical protein